MIGRILIGTLSFHTIRSLMLIRTFSSRLLSRSPSNSIDVFADDVGFVATVDEKGGPMRFNVAAGGGMGVTHGNQKTYPRTADDFGFRTAERGKDVAEKVRLAQRDNGNRAEYVFDLNSLQECGS